VIFALVGPAFAQEPDSAADYRGFVDQARFQIRKGFLDAAAADLQRAAEHPDGRLDAEVWFMLAQVRLELADLPGARTAAEQALTHAKSPDEEAASAALLDTLRVAYGAVRIEGVQPGMALRPKFSPLSPLTDPDLALYVERLERRLKRDRPSLPLSVGLPTGAWDLNGQEVTVTVDQPAMVRLGVRAAGGTLAAVRLGWLDLSIGVGFPLSGEKHLLPSPVLQAAFTVPIGGPFAFGLVFHETANVSLGPDTLYRLDPRGTQVGLRFGPLLDDGERFLIRPSVGYRFGTATDFELRCTRNDAAFSCGSGANDLYIYANGLAHVASATLAADYLDRTGTSPVGGGVLVGLDHAWVLLPESGKTAGDIQADFVIEGASRPVRRTTASVLVNLSITF
jgi:hypothetical protein